MQSTREAVELFVNGKAVRVAEGTTVAAAILIAGETSFRRSVVGEPRGPLCGMGRVTVGDFAYCRSCQMLCRDGMKVQTS
jgi:hypothetical protein